jgi:hypothetical protein
MENPNEYVGLHLANDYIKDRHQFEESRRLLKQIKRAKPGRFYCAICRTLASFGHVLVAFGGRLERYDLVLRQSKIKP